MKTKTVKIRTTDSLYVGQCLRMMRHGYKFWKVKSVNGDGTYTLRASPFNAIGC